MGDKTKIDWCDASWNPVTGCLHDCPYCYARGIAKRFGAHLCDPLKTENHELEHPMRTSETYEYMRMAGIKEGPSIPYPYDFEPTFHRYRLDIPFRWTRPRTIFVCSMADLFGEWVPESWIQAVFTACEAAPQHRYLFLTKNPKRLCRMEQARVVRELTEHNRTHPGRQYKLPQGDFSKITPLPDWRTHDNWWFGSTITDANGWFYNSGSFDNTFLSIEPLHGPLDAGLGSFGGVSWFIIGAETGNRKGKIIPKKEWVMNIVEAAQITHAAVFMKESLRDIMGKNFWQEFPFKAGPEIKNDWYYCPTCGKRLGDNQVYLHWPCECGQRLNMIAAKKKMGEEAIRRGIL